MFIMKITLIFHGNLKKYNNNLPEVEQVVPERTTVGKLVTQTGIPPGEIAFVAISGSRVTHDAIIYEGDEVKIFQLVGGG